MHLIGGMDITMWLPTRAILYLWEFLGNNVNFLSMGGILMVAASNRGQLSIKDSCALGSQAWQHVLHSVGRGNETRAVLYVSSVFGGSLECMVEGWAFLKLAVCFFGWAVGRRQRQQGAGHRGSHVPW